MTTPLPLETEPAAADPIEKLRDPLTRLCDEHIKRECASEKSQRYLQISRVGQYMQGNQYVALSSNAITGAMDYASVLGGGKRAEDSGVYDYNFGIIGPYGDKYAALLGSKPFYNSAAVARNAKREADRQAAKSANSVREWLSSCWHLPSYNVEYFSRLWDSSEVYGYLQYVADERTFGKVEVPQYEEQLVELEPGGFLCRNCGEKSQAPEQLDSVDPMGMPTIENVCPACKSPISDFNWEEPVTVTVPQFVGMARFPQSGPMLTLTTAAYVTTPLDLKRFEDATYLDYAYEEQKGVLLEFFGDDLRKHMESAEGDVRGGSADDTGQGKQTRLSEFSQNGTTIPAMANRLTFARTWLKPAMYEYLKDKELRTSLRGDYPDGVKLSFVEGILVRMEAEDLHDVWTVGVPKSGKGIQHKPLAWAFLGHQDALNDALNIQIALMETSLPSFMYRSDMVSQNAMERKSYLPNSSIPVLPGFGMSLRDGIAQLPTATVPDHADVLPGIIISNMESGSGLVPSAYGGQSGPRKTGLEAEQMLQQSLQVLSTPGMGCSKFWAAIWTMAVRMVAKYAEKDIEFSNSTGGVSNTEVIDLEALKGGEYAFKAEVGIPMSLGERQSRIDTILSQSPAAAVALNLVPPEGQPYVNPANAQAVASYLLPGITDLDTSSQQPEEFVINYAVEAQNVGQWCLRQGQQEAKTNAVGYRNVVLYGMRCAALSAPPPMPEQPGGTPPPDSEQIEAPTQ